MANCGVRNSISGESGTNGRSGNLSQGNPRMARGELPGRDAPAARERGRHLLGRTQMGLQVLGTARMAGADGGEGLDRSRMAPAVWRRWSFARGSQDFARGDARARLPLAARQLRHLDARAGAAEVRQRATKARASAQDRARRNSMMPGLLGAWIRFRPRLSADARRGSRRLLRR